MFEDELAEAAADIVPPPAIPEFQGPSQPGDARQCPHAMAASSAASDVSVSFSMQLLLAGDGDIGDGEEDSQANMIKCISQCQVVDRNPDIAALARTSQGRNQSGDSTNACTAISHLMSVFVTKYSCRPSKEAIDNIILRLVPHHAAAMRQRSRLPEYALIACDAAKPHFQGIAEHALDAANFGRTVVGNIFDDGDIDDMINLLEVEAHCVSIRECSCLSCIDLML